MTHPQATVALRAAALRPSIGPWATLRYLQRRGCPTALYTLARVLRAAQTFGA